MEQLGMKHSTISYEQSVLKVDDTEAAIAWVNNTLHKYGFAVGFNGDATEMFLTRDSVKICQVLNFDRLAALAIGMDLVGDFEGFMAST
jgi:hypothetical protein